MNGLCLRVIDVNNAYEVTFGPQRLVYLETRL